MTARRFKDGDGKEWEVTETVIGDEPDQPPSSMLRFRSLEDGRVHGTSSPRYVDELSDGSLQRALDRARRRL